jgi:hypothetical protein
MLEDSIVDLFAGYNARKQRDHNDKENRFLPLTSYPKKQSSSAALLSDRRIDATNLFNK